MSSKEEFERGIISKDLKNSFRRFAEFFNFSDINDTYTRICAILLSIPSAFGGKEEGVVLKFSDGKILKVQQSYQLDQEKRAQIKNKWKQIREVTFGLDMDTLAVEKSIYFKEEYKTKRRELYEN